MSLNNFNYFVSWSDFNPLTSRPANEDEYAHIQTQMNLGFKMGGKGKSVIITGADMDIIMVQTECWAVTSKKTNHLLNHEQGHFDIQALVAREYLAMVLELTAETDAKMKEKIRQLEIKYRRLTTTMNERYDTETDHSINTSVQKSWDQALEAAKLKPSGTVSDLP